MCYPKLWTYEISLKMFFHQKLYSENFRRLNNDPQCQIDNCDHYCQKHFQKNLKIGLGHFLWPSITYLNQKRNRVDVLVDLTWNSPCILLCEPSNLPSLVVASLCQGIVLWMIATNVLPPFDPTDSTHTYKYRSTF